MVSSNLHLCFLLIITLSFFHVSSSARFYTNADDELIHTICKDSSDNNFCIQTFKNDSRTPAANLDGLCLISVALIIDQATQTSNRIPGLINQADETIMRERLFYCQWNYEEALSKFHQAYTSASAKSYPDVLVKVGKGLVNATDCNATFSYRGGGIQESPFVAETNMLVKLVELPGLVINHIH